nr:MAG: hypothetical protein DIU61_11495 [Bacteroidota bacterium]
MVRRGLGILFFFVCITGCNDSDPSSEPLTLLRAFAGATELNLSATTENVPVDQSLSFVFSKPLNTSTASAAVSITGGAAVDYTVSFSAENTTLVVHPSSLFAYNTEYTVELSDELTGQGGEPFSGAEIRFKTVPGALSLVTLDIGGKNAIGVGRIADVALAPEITIEFSLPLDESSLQGSIAIEGPGSPTPAISLSQDGKSVVISGLTLKDLTRYRLVIENNVRGVNGETFAGYTRQFYTTIADEPKFPLIADDDLLTLIQQQTFKYFWDFAEPVSGMARERNSSGNLVTSGGSGFGIMALIVGIERGFITRAEGLERMDKILDFLESADRFHGAWPHWMDGTTGNVIPFSPNDNGGDLVETSFLVQGLLTFRQYLDAGVAAELELINRINALWHSVEWDWYTRGGQNVLYWHWSPDKNWIMNHRIQGYNECLITYVLAASSPTHTIDAEVYHQGWAQSGAIVNGETYYGITLPLGSDYGGPLFFSHYSFLGLDPRNLSDAYANYWTQNVNHTLINRAYCAANPRGYVGYSDDCWGLTASDNHQGYSAHSPTNDLGVITPTAALSSMPYTPDESLEAARFFYYKLGDRLWGDYGFYDAFNITEQWFANSWLAIDQGPIIVMIENHRTGLLWDLFMSCPEIQDGLTKLGFSY